MRTMRLYRIIMAAIFILGCSSLTFAQDYVAVAKDGKVYDEANAKYVTLNQNNDEVNVIPGMVFATSQHQPGWYKVEYSPGLHAFIPEQIVATNYKTVGPGSYDVKNNPGQKLIVSNDAGNWKASVNNKSYEGKLVQNFLIFTNENNQPIFSLVDFGNGPVAITYDNAVTKFF